MYTTSTIITTTSATGWFDVRCCHRMARSFRRIHWSNSATWSKSAISGSTTPNREAQVGGIPMHHECYSFGFVGISPEVCPSIGLPIETIPSASVGDAASLYSPRTCGSKAGPPCSFLERSSNASVPARIARPMTSASSLFVLSPTGSTPRMRFMFLGAGFCLPLRTRPHGGRPCVSARNSCHQGPHRDFHQASHFPVRFRSPVKSVRYDAVRHARRTKKSPTC